MLKFIIIIASTMMSALAQYLLKIGVGKIDRPEKLEGSNAFNLLLNLILNPYILAGFILYLLSAVIWLYVLSQFELSRAYPFASLGYIFTLILGYYLLGESLTVSKLSGILFIMVGVILVSNGR